MQSGLWPHGCFLGASDCCSHITEICQSAVEEGNMCWLGFVYRTQPDGQNRKERRSHNLELG